MGQTSSCCEKGRVQPALLAPASVDGSDSPAARRRNRKGTGQPAWYRASDPGSGKGRGGTEHWASERVGVGTSDEGGARHHTRAPPRRTGSHLLSHHTLSPPQFGEIRSLIDRVSSGQVWQLGGRSGTTTPEDLRECLDPFLFREEGSPCTLVVSSGVCSYIGGVRITHVMVC
jgi:hypothetical protein